MKKLICLALLGISILGANELESKCNKGDFEACVELGIGYVESQDYIKAKDLWLKACNGRNTKGCHNLGFLYYNGQGVEQDYAKAREYYTKACNGGSAIGCNNLGVLYDNGQGVAQDKKQAKEYLKKACDFGSQDGCNNYKVLNEQGY